MAVRLSPARRRRWRKAQEGVALARWFALISAASALLLLGGLGPSWAWLACTAAVVVLLMLAAIDARTGLLPDLLTLPLLWAGLAWAWADAGGLSLHDAVGGALLGYGAPYALHRVFRALRRREGMGHGDFKLMAALGAWLGPGPLSYVLLAASLLAIAWAAGQGWRRAMARSRPFGPFLVAAAIPALVTGPGLQSGFPVQERAAAMYKVGLTGGIGSGKSRVADLLQEHGVSIIDTDLIAHELTAPGGAAIDALRDAFGSLAITEEGALDRARMRETVFRDSGARLRLEAILHPMIKQLTEQRAAQAGGCYLVFVVPLLVESGRWRDKLDRICVVDCSPATQVARVRARSGLTPEAIARIMAVQASREARLAAADDVVSNDGGTSLEALAGQVRALHEKWCAASRSPADAGGPA